MSEAKQGINHWILSLRNADKNGCLSQLATHSKTQLQRRSENVFLVEISRDDANICTFNDNNGEPWRNCNCRTGYYGNILIVADNELIKYFLYGIIVINDNEFVTFLGFCSALFYVRVILKWICSGFIYGNVILSLFCYFTERFIIFLSFYLIRFEFSRFYFQVFYSKKFILHNGYWFLGF